MGYFLCDIQIIMSFKYHMFSVYHLRCIPKIRTNSGLTLSDTDSTCVVPYG